MAVKILGNDGVHVAEVDATGALKIAGSFSATVTSPEVGLTGAALPTSAALVGVQNSAGTALTFLKANASNALVVDGSAVTQPISNANLNAPLSGLLTTTAFQTRIPTLSVDGSGFLQVNVAAGGAGGGLAQAQVRNAANAWTDVGYFAGNQSMPVSATALPLPTGAATEATLLTILTSANFQARINTLGQKAMAASTPVVLASDQSAIPVTQSGAFTVAQSGAWTVGQSGTWNITNISGTISLPTGAATEATLTGVLSTTAFQARVPTNGQKVMTASLPVVIASDQSAVAVTGTVTANAGTGTFSVSVTNASIAVTQSGAWNIGNITGSITLPTGAATETTLSTRLAEATFTTRIPTNGQKLMAGSLPVVIASDQGNLPISGTVSISGTVASTQSGTWNIGTLTSITNPVAVTQSGTWNINAVTSITNTVTVQGAKTNDNAAPGATNIGALVAVATAAAPTYTTGNLVALSTDLTGALRITGSISASNPSVSTTGAAIPTSSTLMGGSDGTLLRALSVNTSGRLQVDIVSGGGSNASVGTNAAAAPTSSTQLGGPDGSGNLRPAAVINSTPSGTEYGLVVRMAGGASGGTSSNFGSAFPSTGTAAGFTDGTNMVAGRVGANNTDAEAVSTTSILKTNGYLMGYNGTTWDRVRVANTGRLQVDVVTGGGSNASVGATAAAVPASATYVGMTQGGNLTGLTGTGGSLNVNLTNASVAVTGTFFQATQPVSAVSLPLPTGAATEATLAGILTTTAFQARINTLGQKTAANSTPVVLASDQSAIPVTGTFFQATQPISAVALPLPTGAATEATLAAMSAKLPATLGQKTMANSLAVVLSSDQSAISTFNGTIDAGNSSTATLGAGATFTGTAFDSFNFASFVVQVFSNVSSAVNGLSLQFSNDGTNWDEISTYTFTAGGLAFNIQGSNRARFFRVVYTNGGTIQASFRLQTLHKTSAVSGSVLELSDPLPVQTHAQVTRAVLAAENTTNTAVSDLQQGASADAFTNPTVALSTGSFSMGYNGTTWDRLRSTIANGLAVDVTRVQGSVTVAQATAANLRAQTSSESATGAAVAANATQVGGSDGTNLRAVKVDTNGRVATVQQSGTAGISRTATSAVSATILAANTARLGAVIVNESTVVMYVKFGVTASATSYTYRLAANGVLEIAFGYTGRIDAILASGTGNAQVTELTN